MLLCDVIQGRYIIDNLLFSQIYVIDSADKKRFEETSIVSLMSIMAGFLFVTVFHIEHKNLVDYGKAFDILCIYHRKTVFLIKSFWKY